MLSLEETMSEHEKKQETNSTPQPDTDNNKESAELSEEELKKVAGGTLTLNYTKVQYQFSSLDPGKSGGSN
jgi:hypothetical protein